MSSANHEAVHDDEGLAATRVNNRREFPISMRVTYHKPMTAHLPSEGPWPAIVVGYRDERVVVVYEAHGIEHGLLAPSHAVLPVNLKPADEQPPLTMVGAPPIVDFAIPSFVELMARGLPPQHGRFNCQGTKYVLGPTGKP